MIALKDAIKEIKNQSQLEEKTIKTIAKKTRHEARRIHKVEGIPDSTIVHPLSMKEIGKKDYGDRLSPAFALCGKEITQVRYGCKKVGWIVTRERALRESTKAPIEVWAVRLQDLKPIRLKP